MQLCIRRYRADKTLILWIRTPSTGQSMRNNLLTIMGTSRVSEQKTNFLEPTHRNEPTPEHKHVGFIALRMPSERTPDGALRHPCSRKKLALWTLIFTKPNSAHLFTRFDETTIFRSTRLEDPAHVDQKYTRCRDIAPTPDVPKKMSRDITFTLPCANRSAKFAVRT